MKVEALARVLTGVVNGDGNVDITGVAGLQNAGPSDLTFAEGSRAVERAIKSNAGCILVPIGSSVSSKTTISVSNPKLALIRAAEVLVPARQVVPGIHPTAAVFPGAVVDGTAAVGAYVVIEDGANVGANTVVGASGFVGAGVRIGTGSTLHAGVKLYGGVHIGNRVIIHAGTVIGGDGFGYVFTEGRHHKFPQLGRVIIEDDVEIGSNTTIDRGSLGDTVIGAGTKIDNLVQIAHNVRIGKHCVIAAQTGISGSVDIGNYVVIGGQVGIGDKVRIEDQVTIGAQAGIPTGKIIRKGSAVWGTPARPMSEFKKTYAQIVNLPNLAKKVNEISRARSKESKDT
ncbi:MAG TPA: UDP-3-O-(3-hydroxymyristoyl)glucosamine N-acyltransferase [Candidatus Binatia bacterium]|jgi:UDP-3-O-[3-hydroxymyristoyl] glucosamine N-acyltransferase